MGTSRRHCHRVSLMGVITALAVATTPVAAAPDPGQAPYCQPGETPQFRFGFANLKRQLGNVMGDPTECEHSDQTSGDTQQHTTTGLGFYRRVTNTPTFTNGSGHWGLSNGAVIYWTGQAVDPPDSAR